MWAKWQRGNPNRKYEIGGAIRPWTPILLSEPPETFSDGNITRKSKLDIGKIGSSRRVEEATHTKSGALCYDFQ